jgi:acetyl-CoA acetyltransferase/uncharacterized OB-fold protein
LHTVPPEITRPLPALTLETEFFWTGGADGKLRVRECAACRLLLHPSLSVCPTCQSPDLAIAEVSGRATVLAFTVNEHQWLPRLPPPYAIAIVALDDEPTVRLTTNIVGCRPDDVRIGMRVAVRFEHQGDVWIPLFEPVAGPEPDAEPDETTDETPETHPRVARPVATERFEHASVIAGIGISQVGRRLMRPPIALTVEACRAAVDDAGLAMSDIDGLATYPGAGSIGLGGMSEGGVAALEEALRIQPTWHSGSYETPGQSGAIVSAMMAVASGLCRHVLCFRTVWESTHAALSRAGNGDSERASRVGGDLQWRLPFGAVSAANWIAMNANNYFARFGGGRETLATIALNARAHAALNPTAIYREPMTIDDYFAARMISTPFGLYDCDVPCDGSVAFVVSAREVAGDLRNPPVRIDAVGTKITERVSWDQGTIAHEPLVFGPAAHLWSRTSLTPADVDVALLYDGFTFNCLSWLEALGFCGIGEAPAFLESRDRIAFDGDLPLNPHGGQLSGGRTHGFGFVHEAVVQLRAEAGERQVRDAEVAVVATGGGTPGGCLLLTRGR